MQNPHGEDEPSMRLGDSDELYIVHSALDTSSIWTTPWLAEALFQTGVVLIGAGDTHQALLLPCSSPATALPTAHPQPRWRRQGP